jgi:hypothetical protein
LITSPIIIAPIRLKIRTTQGLYRKRRRKTDRKMRAIPSDKTRLVRIILLDISFIGTSKIIKPPSKRLFRQRPDHRGVPPEISPQTLKQTKLFLQIILPQKPDLSRGLKEESDLKIPPEDSISIILNHFNQKPAAS